MKNNDDKYGERNRFWTEQALNQFGFTSNFFFIISLGFFTFLFNETKGKGLFIFEGGFYLPKLLLIISIFSGAVSIVASALTVLSRLHDLRLTRHTVWIRKKSYDDFDLEYVDDYIDLDNYNLWDQMKNFFSTIWHRKYFIKDSEIVEKKEVKEKFSKLRLRNLLLARFSWRMINFQFVTLGISLISYFLSSGI
tara:strand:- start:3674 stop:4255 length:582 start_codon:yes stop_codon:yes gene_type:complete